MTDVRSTFAVNFGASKRFKSKPEIKRVCIMGCGLTRLRI
jgi:hypothetical protein